MTKNRRFKKDAHARKEAEGSSYIQAARELEAKQQASKLVVWELSEDSECWLVEATLDKDLAQQALIMWLDSVIDDFREDPGLTPEGFNYMPKDDLFWLPLYPDDPDSEAELCHLGLKHHRDRWIGQPLFTGVVVQA